jgi:hypothetical protein
LLSPQKPKGISRSNAPASARQDDGDQNYQANNKSEADDFEGRNLCARLTGRIGRIADATPKYSVAVADI